MWFPKFSLVQIFLSLALLFLFLSPTSAIKKCYVVYMGSHGHGPTPSEADLHKVTNSHYNFLALYLGSKEKAKEAITSSYKRHINGFSAILDEEQAAEIAKHPGVVSVFPNRGKQLHTTRSWEFMMLEKNGVVHDSSLWKRARFSEDIIIANLDTGVWPESRSFSDEGYGPVPSRWKGLCQNDTSDGIGVPCNRKLIGGRFFNTGFLAAGNSVNSSEYTPRDYEGHGSHTLSTAGGNFVPGASLFGFDSGTAKGGSPKARVAVYKVCWPAKEGGCYDADILEAFDMALHDGADVLSLSLGGDPADYFQDSLAIGAFHAVKKGVVVVVSAGNSGPTPGTVTNVAPWLITVGASTLDRDFHAFVELPNGKRLEGRSFTQPLPKATFYPLITGAQAKAANASAVDALLCKQGTLDHEKAKGKIMVCLRGETDRLDKGYQASLAGAAGMILCNDEASGDQTFADFYVLPAIHLTYEDSQQVFDYIFSTKDPLGYITVPEVILSTKPAPYMADFSSRGPNTVSPGILKPDITAPGESIIAAYTEGISGTGLEYDNRTTAFNIMSGTSMSCPHVAGVVGLLKKLHPDWSPAAIRSAIMTTGKTFFMRTRDNTVNPMLNGTYGFKATPFEYGSGHIRPNRAQDPGLVYDLTTTDYLDFMCAIGYNETLMQLVADGPYKCPESASLLDFNYPSIAVAGLSGRMTVTRRLKNVGPPGTYAARFREPYGVSIKVEPKVLVFDKIGEEKTFKMTLEAKWDGALKNYEFGGLQWSDGTHRVRSPIVVSGPDTNM